MHMSEAQVISLIEDAYIDLISDEVSLQFGIAGARSVRFTLTRGSRL